MALSDVKKYFTTLVFDKMICSEATTSLFFQLSPAVPEPQDTNAKGRYDNWVEL